MPGMPSIPGLTTFISKQQGMTTKPYVSAGFGEGVQVYDVRGTAPDAFKEDDDVPKVSTFEELKSGHYYLPSNTELYEAEVRVWQCTLAVGLGMREVLLDGSRCCR